MVLSQGGTEFLDTNTVIDAVRSGTGIDAGPWAISSIVLQELFGVFRPGTWTYDFTFRVVRSEHIHALSLRKRKRVVGDKILFSRHGSFPGHALVGHRETAQLANHEGYMALAKQASVHKPAFKRGFAETAAVLTDAQPLALPLHSKMVDDSTDLLERFQREYSLKADLRNSLNDLLLLGQARWLGMAVRTSDSLLCRLGEELLDWPALNVAGPEAKTSEAEWTLGPPEEKTASVKERRERYVNVIWRERRW